MRMEAHAAANRDAAEEALAKARALVCDGGDHERASKLLGLATRLSPGLPGVQAVWDAIAGARSKAVPPQPPQGAAAVAPDAPGVPSAQLPAAEGSVSFEAILNARCHYSRLGLSRGCTDGEVRKAFRRLCLTTHPDRCSHPLATAAFQAVNTAFSTLSDTTLRAAYDSKLMAVAAGAGPPPPPPTALAAATRVAYSYRVIDLQTILRIMQLCAYGNKGKLVERVVHHLTTRCGVTGDSEASLQIERFLAQAREAAARANDQTRTQDGTGTKPPAPDPEVREAQAAREAQALREAQAFREAQARAAQALREAQARAAWEAQARAAQAAQAVQAAQAAQAAQEARVAQAIRAAQEAHAKRVAQEEARAREELLRRATQAAAQARTGEQDAGAQASAPNGPSHGTPGVAATAAAPRASPFAPATDGTPPCVRTGEVPPSRKANPWPPPQPSTKGAGKKRRRPFGASTDDVQGLKQRSMTDFFRGRPMPSVAAPSGSLPRAASGVAPAAAGPVEAAVPVEEVFIEELD